MYQYPDTFFSDCGVYVSRVKFKSQNGVDFRRPQLSHQIVGLSVSVYIKIPFEHRISKE